MPRLIKIHFYNIDGLTKMKRIAINGFSRIERAALKIIIDTPELEIIAVNDLMSINNAAYLLKYDSVYGREGQMQFNTDQQSIELSKKQMLAIHERLPHSILAIKETIFLLTLTTTLEIKRDHLENLNWHGTISCKNKVN